MISYILIAIIAVISIYAFSNERAMERMLFHVGSVRYHNQFDRFISSIFIHADWAHLVFNLFSFYSFAIVLERITGPGFFLVIFFASAIAGDLLAYILHYNNPAYRSLGASAAVAGVIYASVLYMPEGSIVIFPIPVPLPSWLFAIAYIFLSLFAFQKNYGPISHESHIGGAVAGTALALVSCPHLEMDTLLLAGLIILPVPLYFFVYKRLFP